MRSFLLPLAVGLTLTTAAGCDAFDPAPAPAAPATTVAALASTAPGALVGVEEVDLLVYFVPGTDPEEGADETFGEEDVRRRGYVQEDVRRRGYVQEDVRRRGYVQESAPAVAITVAVADLDRVLALIGASPLVVHVELDLTFDIPDLPDAYVPLSDAYTGGLGDVALAEAIPAGSFVGQALPWNVRAVGGDRSSAQAGDGAGAVDVDVYVIDSGVDHPDVDVVEALAFFEDGVTDPGSSLHGTHVAGILAAADDGDGVVGVAPGARVHSIDVFDGTGRASMSQMIRAVRHVTAAKRADPSRPIVVNMSVGARTGTAALNGLDHAIRASIEAGVVYVVAAGNQGAPAHEVSPAHLPEAITVGAHDSDGRFAIDFSNHGARVDLLAPGVRVMSTADGGRYAALDGTSMATPHVAGAAALVLARDPSLSPERVAEVIGAHAAPGILLAPPTTTDRSLRVDRF